MKINATLTSKQTRITVTPCEVSDVIELSYKEYSNLMNNMLADREYFAGRTEKDCCLIILCENSDDGLLVDTQGYAYPRYSAFLPKARTIIQDFVQTLADYVVSEGTQNSEDGKWEVSNDELYYHFGANVTADNTFGKMLEEELKRRCEIESAELTKDGIEYEVKREYSENLREEKYEDEQKRTKMVTDEDIVEKTEYVANVPKCCSKKERTLNKLGMLRSNITDEDKYHDESEHDEGREKKYSLELNM